MSDVKEMWGRDGKVYFDGVFDFPPIHCIGLLAAVLVAFTR
jgi:hypothetical protein